MDVLSHVTSRETALQAVAWCVNMAQADALEIILSTHFKDENLQDINAELVNLLTNIAKSGSPDVLRTLLQHMDETCLQQNIGSAKSYVSKLLGHAVERGDTGMVEILLEKGGDARAMYRGKPLLHLSIDGGFPDVAKKLVEGGASLSQVDRRGDNVLIAALRSSIKDKEAIVRWLIKAGADDTRRSSSGKPLLHIASFHSVDVIDLLISQGHDVDVTDAINGDTPLHVACSHCCQETIVKLLQNGSRFNIVNNTGETPLEKLLKFALDQKDFHSKTRTRVAKALIGVGFRMCVDDTRRKRGRGKGLDKVASLYSSLRKSVCRPPSLQSLCRPVIRGCVSGPGFVKEIDQLDIPCHLKDYLRFEDGELRL